MATLTIVSVQLDNADPANPIVNATVRVNIGTVPAPNNVEFNASTPRNDSEGNPKTVAVMKAELGADVRRQWQAQKPQKAALGGLTGTITIDDV